MKGQKRDAGWRQNRNKDIGDGERRERHERKGEKIESVEMDTEEGEKRGVDEREK